MSNILKRTLGIVMAVVMIFAFLPMVNGQAYADTVISRVDLTYDEDIIDLNTAWTESEVGDRVRGSTGKIPVGVTTTGVWKYSEFLFFINEDGIGEYVNDSEEYVRTDRVYLLNYVLKVKDGYTWHESILDLPMFSPASDCPEFEVYVNGTECTGFYINTTYLDTYGYIEVFVPLEIASDTPIVKSVTIFENDMSLEVGDTYAFTGEVAGNVDNKNIVWSVSGAESSATVITSDGVLTIGENETAETLTVTATAAADPTKTDSVTITVLSEAPYIESVEINPSQAVVMVGKSQQFEAIVEGTQTDKSVTWGISEQKSTGTSISEDGLLTIASNETAEKIKVTVYANKDNSKTDEATVTVIPLTIIDHIDLTYDKEIIDLNMTRTESEVGDRVRGSTGKIPVGVTTTGVWKYSEFLFFINEDGIGEYVNDSEEYVRPDRVYLLNYVLKVNDGYTWHESILDLPMFSPASDCPEFEVYVNGTECMDFYINTTYLDTYGYIEVFVPINVDIKPGWHEIGGNWYYYNTDGTAVTGWKKVSKKWYYFDASGVMQTGWQKISGKWYYFNASGAMQTGWQKISNKWYYFNTSGEMLTGWQKISGKDYFFKSSGAMAANEWVKGYWWINKDGTWTYNYKGSWKKSGSKWWFGDTSGWYAKNTTITIDGKKYTFDAKGYMI